jgi:DNA replication factor GINS
MNLDELQSVRSKERRTDSLQHLRDSFYEDVRDYLAERKAARDRAAERADDPFASPEVRQLTDEIESAKEVVEAVYERRMGKLVKHASLVAAGMNADEEGMTTEERELFFDLVDRIERNKRTVLGTIEGDDADGETDVTADAGQRNAEADAESSTTTPAPMADEPVSSGAVTAADAMAGSGQDDAIDDPRGPDAESVGPPDPESDASSATGTTDRPQEEGNRSAGTTTGSGVGPGDHGDPGVEHAAGVGDGSSRIDGSSVDSSSTNERSEDASANARADPAADGDSTAPERHAAVTPQGDDRVTVRITADVGEILGVDDRAYDLESEDVIALPRQNAEPLLDREAAERLE